MALKTSEEYVERLRKMKPNVYAHGRKIGRDDPILELPINTLKFTFDAHRRPLHATGNEAKVLSQGWRMHPALHGGGYHECHRRRYKGNR